jgi:vesicular inhibitory amino acid transporter
MPRNPSTFEEYQYGTSHRSSVGSVGDRSVHFNEEASPSATTGLLDFPPNERGESGDRELRRRRHA